MRQTKSRGAANDNGRAAEGIGRADQQDQCHDDDGRMERPTPEEHRGRVSRTQAVSAWLVALPCFSEEAARPAQSRVRARTDSKGTMPISGTPSQSLGGPSFNALSQRGAGNLLWEGLGKKVSFGRRIREETLLSVLRVSYIHILKS